MRNLRFISAQPTTEYYAWQVEVMLVNFIEMGVNPNNIDIVGSVVRGVVPENWRRLAEKYPARFLFYNDTRNTKHYISSIRPNILKQHFAAFPELEQEAIFYHDSDIIFTKPVSTWITEEMLSDDKWYGSDTRWYIGHDYILSKGEDVLNSMCGIVGISPEVVKSNELNSIGAQYLMKGIDSYFWAAVERHSENLFRDITAMNVQKEKQDPKYHSVQIWCADMWAVLWNGWKLGYETICHENLDFSWGTSNLATFNEKNIFHNAGVTDATGGYFFKAAFMHKNPYNHTPNLKPDTASAEYWKWVQKAAEVTVLK